MVLRRPVELARLTGQWDLGRLHLYDIGRTKKRMYNDGDWQGLG
jgi:hypothetical protein